MEQVLNNGDQNRLVKFDSVDTAGKDYTSVLMKKAMDINQYCKKFMNSNTFDRRDYKYLNELALLFLGEELRQFHFRQPGAHMKLGFWQIVTICYDNMQFLVKDENIEQMRIACTYIACFHAQMFIQSTLAAKKPGYDLN